MKTFEVPEFYKSPIISKLKTDRKLADKLKKDYTPSELAMGNTIFYLARHFGFCYGVENAIEIAFKAVNENPNKRIFLLSEMIHNPQVNTDLQSHGVQFILDTHGNTITPWESITKNDIVVIPAFGTTLDIEEKLKTIGIDPMLYNTTCPFVEKVWNRSEQIGKLGYSIIIHGKPNHEETKATFSHSSYATPSVIVKNIEETKLLALYITGEKKADTFYIDFEGQYSNGFDVNKHLEKIGVVNQTTMLASETQEIANYLKQVMIEKYQLEPEGIKNHYADTRDTLCYATLDNQTAVKAMLEVDADFALVIGGYNSSNTSHLVELCEEKLPTYYIKDETCLTARDMISHFNFHTHQELTTTNFLPSHKPLKVLITSGASCPDAIVEKVMIKLSNMINQ